MIRFIVESIDNGFIVNFEGDELGITKMFFRKDIEGVLSAISTLCGDKESPNGESI